MATLPLSAPTTAGLAALGTALAALATAGLTTATLAAVALTPAILTARAAPTTAGRATARAAPLRPAATGALLLGDLYGPSRYVQIVLTEQGELRALPEAPHG